MDYMLHQVAIIATILLGLSFAMSLVVRPPRKNRRHNAWDGNQIEPFMTVNLPNIQLPYKTDIQAIVSTLGGLNASLQELTISVKEIATNMRK